MESDSRNPPRASVCRNCSARQVAPLHPLLAFIVSPAGAPSSSSLGTQGCSSSEPQGQLSTGARSRATGSDVDRWLIPFSELEFVRKIGQGAFGQARLPLLPIKMQAAAKICIYSVPWGCCLHLLTLAAALMYTM
jgi:hypothetical protein